MGFGARFAARWMGSVSICGFALMLAAAASIEVWAIPCVQDADCNDGNPCTTDSCNGSAQCAFVANTNPCDDGDPCTQNDVCANSACGGFPVDCDDSSGCTADTCESAGNAFLCVHTPNGSCGGSCGNGVIDPGETCDPPGTPSGVQGLPCRTDCTVCGDGILQAPETCDDGNTASGCRLDQPQKPLDSCLNSCTEPICADPSKVKFGTDPNPDLVTVHGRLVTDAIVDVANEQFVVQLTRGDDIATVIFRSSLPSGSLIQVAAAAFKYQDKTAKTAGGMYTVKVNAKPGYYKFTLKAYGDVSG